MKRLFSAVFLLLLAFVYFTISGAPPNSHFAAALQELGVALTALSNSCERAIGAYGHIAVLFLKGGILVNGVMLVLLAIMTLFKGSPKSQP